MANNHKIDDYYNNKTVISKYSFTGFLVSCFVFVSMGPFFFWNNNYIFALIGMGMVSSMPFVINKKQKKTVIHLFFFYSLFCLFAYFPFREYDSLRLGIITLIIPVFFTLLDRRVFTVSYNILYRLFFLIAIISVCCWILYTIRVPFPHWVVEQNFRANANTDYLFYFGVVILNSQFISIPGGGEIFRNSAWFAEPSHYGIYASIILSLHKNPFYGFKNKIYIISLLLTFSVSVYFCLFIIYILRTKGFKTHLYVLVSFLIMSVIFISSSIGEAVLDRYLIAKISSNQAIESRSEFNGPDLMSLEVKDLFFGKGFDYLNYNGWILSDYRGIIYKYGLLALIAFNVLVFYYIYSEGRFNNKALTVSLLVLFIVLHRSWILLGPTFFYAMMAAHWLQLDAQYKS